MYVCMCVYTLCYNTKHLISLSVLVSQWHRVLSCNDIQPHHSVHLTKTKVQCITGGRITKLSLFSLQSAFSLSGHFKFLLFAYRERIWQRKQKAG